MMLEKNEVEYICYSRYSYSLSIVLERAMLL